MFVLEKTWKHAHQHENNIPKIFVCISFYLKFVFSAMSGKLIQIPHKYKTARILMSESKMEKIACTFSISHLLEDRSGNLFKFDRIE